MKQSVRFCRESLYICTWKQPLETRVICRDGRPACSLCTHLKTLFISNFQTIPSFSSLSLPNAINRSPNFLLNTCSMATQSPRTICFFSQTRVHGCFFPKNVSTNWFCMKNKTKYSKRITSWSSVASLSIKSYVWWFQIFIGSIW